MRRVAIAAAMMAGLALAGCAAPSPGAVAPPSETATAPEFTMTDFCAGVGKVVSEVWNADIGYIGYGVTAEQWTERIARANRFAEDLVTASTEELRPTAERLRDAVAGLTAPPSAPDSPTKYDIVEPIFRQINQGAGGCVANGTEVGILAEFGG